MATKSVQPAFILTVKVVVAPENAAKFLSHFKPAYERALAEPECAYFLFGQKHDEPGVFQWTEGWTKDPAWFMKEQITKDYYKPYLEATEPLFIKEREAEIFIPQDGMLNFKL
ncbi:Antibiotic biosynthesis monooxygenase domain-containing protein [Mycena sanguinolenta]|uniref:Antibiotic biosynthesis monooxygenase domain-containing protein n=1 Tax=Mycena sanguinolenta TaxID=230812 RepID=A0A8H7CY40_9AGAR|nr:Antibiotic biosynthesis monooxygenase domain-containing protein [Mycena sanguinolenta]